MDLNDLLRAIVPLSFLAIWALTSLFNRDAKPLPPRQPMGGPLGPYPPRPMPGEGFAPGRQPQAELPREPSMRWGTVESTPARRPAAPNDDILIIREPARPSPPTRDREGPPRRNRSKSQPPRKPEPEPTQAALGGAVRQSVNQHGLKPMVVTPLSVSTTTESANAARADLRQPPTVSGLPTGSGLPLTFLKDPARLREAFMLNVILGPPIARSGPRSNNRPA